MKTLKLCCGLSIAIVTLHMAGCLAMMFGDALECRRLMRAREEGVSR